MCARMGRLVAIAVAVAAAGIAVVVVNGPGIDKPERQSRTPARESTQVASINADGSVSLPGQRPAATGRPGATVRMRALRFVPSRVTVQVGQAVRFVNRDDVAHTVVQDVGARSGIEPLFGSQRVPPGATFTYVPRSPGTIAYVCTLHPTVMSGELVVRPARA